MPMIDTHAHYCDEWFTAPEGEEQDYAALLDALFSPEGGIEAVINVATNPDNAAVCLAQAARWPQMYAAVGMHPTDAQRYDDPVAELARFRPLLERAEENKIVALGEIGLDYHYADTDRAKQQAVFDAQLSLADAYGLPVIVHCRDSIGDCVEMIRVHSGVRGVFHAYGGSVETARELISRGWLLGLGGVITFKNARRIREMAAALPLSSVVLETDCPYTAPEPFRGRRNHSGMLRYTAARLAELQGCPVEEVISSASLNARRFFKIL